MTSPRPGVLMVVGAYFPELSGAGLQCRTLISRLGDRVDFTVLTTTADRALPTADSERGIAVHRVFIDTRSVVSKALGVIRFTAAFLRTSRRFSIVHLHGFSQKSLLIVVLALLSRKKVAIKLTSFGDDDPMSIARRGVLPGWCYRRADLFFAVSPRFRESYDAARLPPARFRLIANGVDLERFRPPVRGEREGVRHELGLPENAFIVLFVAFFSREKQPDLLFEAWADAATAAAPDAVLVFVGATASSYYEVDPDLAPAIRRRATALGLSERVRFIETTHAIERYQRAANVFAMPSLREGMPNALLEAMASGLACVVSRLDGITDRIIDDGRSGLLVAPGDRTAWGAALLALADDRAMTERLGEEARRVAVSRYGLDQTASAYFDAYQELLGRLPCVA